MPTPAHADVHLPRVLKPMNAAPLLCLPQGLAVIALLFLLATGMPDQLTTPRMQLAVSRCAPGPLCLQPRTGFITYQGTDTRQLFERKAPTPIFSANP